MFMSFSQFFNELCIKFWLTFYYTMGEIEFDLMLNKKQSMWSIVNIFFMYDYLYIYEKHIKQGIQRTSTPLSP